MTRFAFRAGLIASAVLALAGLHVSAQDDNHREITIAAKDGAFHPAKVEVRQNDLVKVTFTAEDGPHSLNVDAYRIAKRARPGRPAVFEFRADRAGTFPYYCNLSESAGSHDMKGELIVRER
jgi:heme/copper-type cytochrome/quinol oxidase subunit 2